MPRKKKQIPATPGTRRGQVFGNKQALSLSHSSLLTLSTQTNSLSPLVSILTVASLPLPFTPSPEETHASGRTS